MQPDATTRMILVVEDDDTLRLLIAKQLNKLGYQVQSAKNGLEALERLKANTFLLILMDIQMPKMDGLECTKAIRSAETGHKRIPIIAVTANPDQQRFLDEGMDDFIFKPVMIGQLEELLNRWIPSQERQLENESPACKT